MSDIQTLHALSRNTVSLIGSCQVITSVYSVVKELVENSLDANATTVDVKLEDFGLEKIEVSDNGTGIKTVDVPFMAKRHFTSKISSSEDLDSLTTYGFRGEALGSLCAVSHMTITTKTAEDPVSLVYTIGPNGDVLDKRPSHNGKGTIVSSKNLFHNVPVRKQYYSGSQRKKEDLKRIEYLLMMYAVVRPDLRLTLKHGKDLVFQKTAMKDVKTALHSVLGRQVANQLLYKEKFCEDLKINISTFLPKPGSDIKEMSLVSADKTFIAVNKRPVFVTELNKVLKSYYSNCHGLDSYRHPVCFVSLDVATNQIDVNVDPNKTKVFFQQKTDIITALEEILVEIYGPLENVPSWHYREADDGSCTSKDTNSAPPKDIKNITRPFISYSKRPEDAETAVNEGSDEKGKDSSSEDVPNSNSRPLPSFSLTFHSNPSQQISSNSKSLNESTNGSVDSENLEASVKCSQRLGKETVVNLINETDVSKEDDIISENLCKIKSVTTLNNDNGNSPPRQCENDTITPVQEVTVIEDCETATDKSLSPLGEGDGSNRSCDKRIDEDGSLSVLNVDPSNWSKGNVTVGNTLLQPVKLLPPSSSHRPGKRPASPSKPMESSQSKRKVAKLNILANQTTLYDMMNTQKAPKPDSPFTHFYQEKSPGLSQEFPNEESPVLREKLKDEWDKMTDDERVSYREKCWQDTKRYEKDKASQSNVKNAESKSSKKTNEKLKKTLKKRLYCKEHSIRIPMNKIRNSSQEFSISTTGSEPNIIGPVHQSDDVWIFTLHNKMYLANVWRLAEVSLYRKLKAEHQLSIQPCDPIVLDSSTINDQGMMGLESMAKKCQGVGTYFHIQDERLVANGFDVKCHCDPNGNLSCELVGICDVIPAYGVKDLNVVLGVVNSNEDATLSKTRTLKAAYYLQGEAVRMSRQNAGKKTPDQVQTLLAGAKVDQPCLHHKPIFHEVFDLSSLHPEDDEQQL